MGTLQPADGGRLELEGGTSFTFVTNGIEAALEQAKRAANGSVDLVRSAH